MRTATATIILDTGLPLTVEAEYTYEAEDPWDRDNGPGCPEAVLVESVTIRGVPAALTDRQYCRVEAAILERLRDDLARERFDGIDRD